MIRFWLAWAAKFLMCVFAGYVLFCALLLL